MVGPQSQPDPRPARTTTMFTVDPYYSSADIVAGAYRVTGGKVKVATGSSARESSFSYQCRGNIYVLMANPLRWLLLG
ncbi:hypothetical protein E2C01_015109 [Portunus trituberculatus]|uniref:Uncharacterized protein n=1 Tax=Portunus trituberculatus TaxID=210409 RepID=A0A5B7DLY1_PORTR|nr:hypothetical protein [Portunus trituberculatus]